MRTSLVVVLLLCAAGALGRGGKAHTALALGARAATPADALVGQEVTACNYGKNLDVVVTAVDWTDSIADGVAPRGSMWVVALINVTNLSDVSEALTSRPLQLEDADGNIYLEQEDPPDIYSVATLYDVAPPSQEFDPGVMTPSVVTFLIPSEAHDLTLVGRSDYC